MPVQPRVRGGRSAQSLRQPLDRLYREFDYASRLDRDAIQFPLRYADPRDREIVALLTACLAYGRVDLFGRALEGVLAAMGPSPWAFVHDFDPARDARGFERFIYRFNRPRDLVALCVAMRDLLARHGTLERCFVSGDDPAAPHVGPALEAFSRAFLAADVRALFPRGRLSRGYRHLFPMPSTGGPCKRLHLFLRWMVRREAPDFGLWTTVSPSRLLVPVDTHIENMSRAIGLTRRRSRTWRMAEEITARLALLDPTDPVKYDFALCHKRMSGDCRDRRDVAVCTPCGLRVVCRHWQRVRGPERAYVSAQSTTPERAYVSPGSAAPERADVGARSAAPERAYVSAQSTTPERADVSAQSTTPERAGVSAQSTTPERAGVSPGARESK